MIDNSHLFASVRLKKRICLSPFYARLSHSCEQDISEI